MTKVYSYLMRVLIVDDESAVREAYAQKLKDEGFEVVGASDGVKGLKAFYAVHPDIIVLDMVMPQMDGLAVVRQVRETSTVPILIFTGQATGEDEIVQALLAGADEYLVKPVRLNEFAARVHALLRRAQIAVEETTLSQQNCNYEDDYLSIDVTSREVRIQGDRLHLTPTEYKLLVTLLENAGTVVPQRELLRIVWGPEYMDDIYYPRVYVSQLRRKIEPDPADPVYILTEHRVGYRFGGRMSVITQNSDG
jgi:two-component system KDP operon response regulator KdpE